MRDRSVVVIAIEFVLTMEIFVTKKTLDHGANARFKHRISTDTPSPMKNSRMSKKTPKPWSKQWVSGQRVSHYKKPFYSKLDKNLSKLVAVYDPSKLPSFLKGCSSNIKLWLRVSKQVFQKNWLSMHPLLFWLNRVIRFQLRHIHPISG